MKKYLLLLLALPLLAYGASYPAAWTRSGLTSTDTLSPQPVNGVNQGLSIPSTATSTFAGGVYLLSTFAGGENTTDSTKRITLESYQRAESPNNFGEVMRIYSRDPKSKQMLAWYDGTTTPALLKAWAGWHYGANDISDPLQIHDHFAIETPDSGGLLRTRLEVVASSSDVTQVNTFNSNFTVIQGTNGVSGLDGVAKPFTIYTAGANRDRTIRWSFQGNSTLESGSDVGTDFQISSFNDAGSFTRTPFFIKRSTGNVGIATTTATTGRLEVDRTTDAVGIAVNNFAASNNAANYLAKTTTSASRVFQAGTWADTTQRLSIEASGKIEWGPGGSTARDTNLYRGSANSLVTDDNFGIGTTTPAFTLQVNGPVDINSAGAGANLKHYLITNESGAMKFSTSTDVYATTTSPTLTLNNNGDVTLGYNLMLPTNAGSTTAAGIKTQGYIFQGGTRWMHNFGPGNSNLFIGLGAGPNFTANASTSIRNVCIGDASCASIGASGGRAISNIGLGRATLTALTTGTSNIGIGDAVLAAITTGGSNTCVGDSSCLSAATSVTGLTAFGASALGANTSGTNNTGAGSGALAKNTTGIQNSGFGRLAGNSQVVGDNNTYLGYQSGFSVDNSTNNTFVGHTAGMNVGDGDNNTFVGKGAGLNATTTSNSIIIGAASGQSLGSGSGNILIGYNLNLPSTTASNQLDIGNLIYSQGIDGSATTTISTGNIGIATTTPQGKLEVFGGGLKLDPGAVGQPTCTATVRGEFWYVKGGVGVKDQVEVCAKDAADAYAWRVIY